MSLTTTNPATGEHIADYPFTEDLDDVLDRAAASVALAHVDDRRARLCVLAARLRANSPEYALLITTEMGKPLEQASAEIEKCALTCDYYIDNLEELLAPRSLDLAPDCGFVQLLPLGAILTIMPWNYPFWQVFRAVLPAVAVGNTVLLKHADNVTGSGYAVQRLFDDVFGTGVLATETADRAPVGARRVPRCRAGRAGQARGRRPDLDRDRPRSDGPRRPARRAAPPTRRDARLGRRHHRVRQRPTGPHQHDHRGAVVTITNIRARAVGIPVDKPTRMSNRDLSTRHYVLVEITDDEGNTGLGYTYAGTAGGFITTAAVDDLLAPVYLGADQDDVYGLWARAYQETLLAGRRGAVIRALSAIDIALWDLKAKRAGQSLARLLGGSTAAQPAYASGGYYQPGEGDWCEAVAREIAFNSSQGFTDHKIKVGGLSVAEDARRVATAIDAIGDPGRLSLDANNAYHSVREAQVAIEAFERAAGDRALWWFEEPLSPEAVLGHGELAARIRTPVATGEIHQTRWDFRGLIDAHAASILQTDAGVVGGVSEWLRVAHTADSFGLQMAPHWHHNLHVHLTASVTNTLVVEYFALEKGIYNFELLLTPGTRLAYRDNTVLVPDRAGLGIELDESAVAKFEIAS
ncbi:MAG TPA: aldehyde dehydrogenase family protein [Pseudonocardia sp.]|jgi:L-alanine-DL-glutamate epimerase-like enolase superfamily enzyme|uniref:aldehyde dehydrogenase family protein n=1 Tax=Pseudonocardia sp. TaxID=60912 RepID=UPI002F4124E4